MADENLIRLPVEVPQVKDKDELRRLIAQTKAKIEQYKRRLRMLVWTTEFNKIKDSEQSVMDFVETGLATLIDDQNVLGKAESSLTILEAWLADWDEIQQTKPVEGFASFVKIDDPTVSSEETSDE